MSGLTAQGYKRKTYNDLITDMETRAKSLFGNDVNLTVRSFLGILIRIIAWFLSLLWQDAEDLYNSAYVDTSEGAQLNKVSKNIGITRLQTQKAVGQIQIVGENDTVVPAGFIVETSAGIQFETLNAVIITDGTASADIQAVNPGTSGNIDVEMITQIVNPIVGVESVSNSENTSGGRDQETDPEFRDRYAVSVAKAGASTIDSIMASLLEVSGVRAAIVIPNNTMVVDPDGRPPKSIQCIVLGGSSQSIAATIFKTKAGGIQTFGTEETIVNDIAGNPHTINFTYAESVDVYINVTITKNAKYPPGGDIQVRTAILKYIGGSDSNGSIYPGLGMGQDPIYTKLISTVYAIPGVDDLEVELSTDGINFVHTNISIGQTEVAESDYNKVVVSSV